MNFTGVDLCKYTTINNFTYYVLLPNESPEETERHKATQAEILSWSPQDWKAKSIVLQVFD